MSKLVELLREYQEKFPDAKFEEAIYIVIGYEKFPEVTKEIFERAKPRKGKSSDANRSTK